MDGDGKGREILWKWRRPGGADFHYRVTLFSSLHSAHIFSATVARPKCLIISL